MFNTKTKLQEFEKKSEAALNIFQATIDSLTSTNTEIVKEKVKKAEAIKALKEEEVQLQGLEEANSLVIDKIQSFLLR